MKTIKWYIPATAGVLALVGVLVTQAGATDAVYHVRDVGTITAGQAGGYFATFANEQCQFNSTSVSAITWTIQSADDGSTEYPFVCTNRITRTFANAMLAMDTAAGLDNVSATLDGVVDGTDLYVKVTKTGTLTQAEFFSYVGSFITDKCSVAREKVDRVMTYKSGSNWAWRCKGASTDTYANVEALYRDSVTDATKTVVVTGSVSE